MNLFDLLLGSPGETMRIEVRVIPNAKKDKVLEEEGKLKVYVVSPASEGRANRDLIKILADHFKVKKDAIRIIKGERSRHKVIEIILSDNV